MRRNSVPGIVALLCAAATPSCWAQTADATPQAPQAPSARAQRDAEKVFQWIRLHSDKPRRWDKDKEPKDAGAAKPAVAAPVAARPAPVAAAPAPLATPPVQSAPPRAASVATAPPASPASPATSVAGVDTAASAAAAQAAPTVAPASLTAAPLVSDNPAPPGAPAPAASEPGEAEPDEEPLTLVNQVEPRFSAGIMQSLRKGVVQVRFEVRPDGTVGETEVVRTTSTRLNGAALAAVAQWRFQPLRKAQTGLVDLSFNLD